MSSVEKAADKLRALRSEPQVSPPVDAASIAVPHAPAPDVERLQERHRVAEPRTEASEPWHVDLMLLERMGYLPANDGGVGRLRDELRRIKRPLLANVMGRGTNIPDHANRIVVTSASSGEGKTFTTLNLAMSMAREPDFEVLLVDGDIPRCSITHALGLKGRPGLMEALADERRDPSEVIVHTDIPNLMVVPAGEAHPLTAELFGSRRMEDVLKAFSARNRRRLILFDSSPLLATSESQVLASYMGQVVVVVASRRTRQQALNASLQLLHDSQYVALVLNMSQLPSSEDHYDDGYGY